MTNIPRSRRSYLAIAGGVVPGVLAGCTEEDNDTHHGDHDDHDDHGDHDDHDDHDDHGDHDDHDDHDHEHGYELGHPEEHVEVEMITGDGHHFIPHVVHVEVGGTVEWVVESGDHNTVAYHPETHGPQQRIPDGTEPWASDMLTAEGETYTHTFDVEGVYDYVCTPHEEVGMIGSILVGWPDPDEQPGLESPSEEYSDTVIDSIERYNDQVRDVLENGDYGY